MKESVWLFIGRWAMIWTVLTFVGGFVGQQLPSQRADVVDTLGGVISMVWWVVFAIGATNVVSDVGTHQYMGVSVIATAMAGLMLLVVGKGTVYLVDVRDIAGQQGR